MHFLPRSERWWHVSPLWLINSGYLWAVRRHIAEGSTVVELGCAGGVRYFGQRFRMIGCDLSFSSLKKISGIYECCVQADAAACIPLPDHSVDAVISSYFWEHIPPELKPKMLAECNRILRPDGKIIFLYDVETENPLIQRFKNRDIDLYRKLFIEGDGHLGYQTVFDNIAIFQGADFQILEHRGMEKTWLQSPSVYIKLAQYGGISRHLFHRTRMLGNTPWFYPYTVLTRLIDRFVCPLLPDKWSRIAMAICEKKPT